MVRQTKKMSEPNLVEQTRFESELPQLRTNLTELRCLLVGLSVVTLKSATKTKK